MRIGIQTNRFILTDGLREHHRDRRQGAEAADGERAPEVGLSARTSDAH